MKFLKPCIALTVLVLSSAVYSLPEITVASLPWSEDTLGVKALDSTLSYLSSELKGKYEIKHVSLPAEELKKAVTENKVDYFISNSLFYTSVSASSGGQTAARIAVLWNPRTSSPTYGEGATIVVRKDSNIHALSDLQEKSLFVPSQNDTFTYLSLLGEIAKSGHQPREFFKSVEYGDGKHKTVIEKVLSKEADIGVVRTCYLEEHPNYEVESQLRVVNLKDFPVINCKTSTDLYLGTIFAATAEADPYLNRLILKTLLEMPAENGYIWTAGGNLSASHALLQTLNAEQYGSLSQKFFFRKLQEHADVLILLALIVAGLISHSIRSNYLIEKRTKELKEIQKTFNETTQKLNNMQKVGLIGLMSSMIGHELKQPLTIIMNYLQGLKVQSKTGKLDAKNILTALTQIEMQTVRANAIIQRVRSYAKQEKPQVQSVNFNQLIHKAVTYLNQTAQRHVKVSLKLPKKEVVVQAEPTDLELSVYNLLKNAADACTEVKKPEITVELTEDSRVELKIFDNAPEIDEETFKNLGTLFKSSKQNGLGLGLAIVKRVAEANGGRLEFQKDEAGRLFVILSLPKFEERN